jgi:hypothetical protein
MSTAQSPVPLQAPLHSTNVDALLGVATSRIAALLGYAPAHTPDRAPAVIVQERGGDASGAVTVPEPAPLACTRSTCCVWGVGVRPALPSPQLAGPTSTTHAANARAHPRCVRVSTRMCRLGRAREQF